jgi:hypothetical protein
VQYGYRITEVDVPIEPKDPSTKIVIRDNQALEAKYVPVSESLGPACVPYALPKADVCPENIVTSVSHRLGREFPKVNKKLFDEFLNFVTNWIQANVEPLVGDTDVSFENWLEECPYPARRKIQLREVRAVLDERTMDENELDDFLVKCFLKDEDFPTFKAARTIASRNDFAKVVLGPWIKKFDHDLFARPQFIKTVPIRDRPQYILDVLGEAGPFVITDYTGFESLFTPEMIAGVELKYMTKLFSNMPAGRQIMDLLNRTLATTNHLKFRDVDIRVKGRRMSGEMNTSSGNGFTNAMIIEFAAFKAGSTVSYVCEGDDGAAKFSPNQPSVDVFSGLGIRVKLEEVNDICRASFCGNVFDPIDRNNVCDPMDFLIGFAWSNKRYVGCSPRTKKALLRAKALSAAYQYPGCPIIQSFAERILKLTAGYDLRRVSACMCLWEREQLLEAQRFKYSQLHLEIGMGTRILVEELYGISVNEQICLENFFQNCDLLQPYVLPPGVCVNIPDSWAINWQMYVTDSDQPPNNQSMFNQCWRQLAVT